MGDSLDQGRPAKRIKLAPHTQPSHPHSQSQDHTRQRTLRPAPDPAEAAAAAAAVPAFHVIPSGSGARGGRRVRRRVRSRGGGRAAASGVGASRPPLQVPVDAGSSPASTESTSSVNSISTLHWPTQEQIHMAAEAVDRPIEMTLIPLDNDLCTYPTRKRNKVPFCHRRMPHGTIPISSSHYFPLLVIPIRSGELHFTLFHHFSFALIQLPLPVLGHGP